MQRSSLPSAVICAMIFAATSACAQQAPQNNRTQTTQHVWTNADLTAANNTASKVRIWTNKDMDELRARDLLSIVGSEEIAAAPSVAAQPQAPIGASPETAPPQIAPPGPVYKSQFEDPRWYGQQAAAIQQQIDGAQATLDQARANLDAARNLRGTTGSIDITQGNIGVTPEEGIARLEEQIRILQEQEDDLADTARRNDVPPGALRSAG